MNNTTDIVTPLSDLAQSVSALESQIRAISEKEIDAEGDSNPHVPWATSDSDSAQVVQAKQKIRTLEIERRSYAKACTLSGAGEALAVLYQANIEVMVRELGPLADWDGTEASLRLIIEATTPDHDSGDARAKRQFVRDTLPAMKWAGVPSEHVAQIAARRSMRPRLAAAVSSINKEAALTPEQRKAQIQKAATDAMTETARSFDDMYKRRRVEMLIYDEQSVSERITRRVYYLTSDQRAMLDNMLQGREQKADMPLERRPTLRTARDCWQAGNMRDLYVALLPDDAYATYQDIRTWGPCDKKALSGSGASLEASLALLLEYDLISVDGETYTVKEKAGNE